MPVSGSPLSRLGIAFEVQTTGAVARARRERLDAVRRWYAQDWVTIDSKLRPGIIEGLSVFLSVFDLRNVGATFRPGKPPAEAPARPAAVARQLRPLN